MMKLRGEFEVHSDDDRVKLIADLVEEGSADPFVIENTVKILKNKGIEEKDAMGEIGAIFDWVKNNIRYTGDVLCRDSYKTAKQTMSLGFGDCDCMSILLGSMLAGIGYPVGARIVSMRKDLSFHHIYTLVGVGNRYASGLGDGYKGLRWVPLDAVNKNNRVGDEPSWVKKRDFIFVCGE